MVNRRIKFAIWWRNAGTSVRAAVFLVGLALLALIVYLRRPDDESIHSTGGVLVFILVNINIAILFVLAFLIGRNVVKLILSRRQGILGAKLRSRLVVAFVGLTLVPTTILFVSASGLLSKAMQGWFSSQVEAAVNGAVDVSHQHYNWVKNFARDFAMRSAREIQSRAELWKAPNLQTYLEGERRDWEIFSLTLLRADGSVVASAQSAAAAIENFSEPPPDKEARIKAVHDETVVLLEQKEPGQFVRAYAPLRLDGRPAVLMASLRISPELTQALETVNASFRDYQQLKILKRPIKSSYILMLSMITGLILFAAIWIAFYIARELTVPIQRLAEATRSVARGRYDFQIREKGDDEMAVLVKSFNQMTAEIRSSRQESERRRIYIETILANLAVGVIGLDMENHVTSVNAGAARIFGLSDLLSAVGEKLDTLLPSEILQQLQPLLDEVADISGAPGQASQSAGERQITVPSQGRELKVLSTAGSIVDENGKRLGCVLLFDDITDLSKAQAMAAWREVAQRIAHEIKNPLTPIQLAAQGLAKLVRESMPGSSEPKQRVLEHSQTIVEHVNSIKRLADEFSRFARMPQAEFAPANLNTLISDILGPFAESYPDILFQFVADPNLPPVEIDKEQIRRVFINLIDNSAAALREARNGSGSAHPGARITLRSAYDRRRRMATLEVVDNGPGIKRIDKGRVFEPYFTTKKGGTGLGLAIVTSIVAEHQGVIRVYDNFPQGARFVVDLPVSQSGRSTQRRFAAAAESAESDESAQQKEQH